MPRRNVVLVVADDLGLQLGCYGDPNAQTPHLDALAARGMRFDQAFCTTASCSASRSVILTGLQNHANGQFGHQHDLHNFHTYARLKGLGVLLSAAGYHTIRAGKLHVQPDSVYAFETHVEPGIAGGPRNPVAMANAAGAAIDQSGDRPFFLYFCPGDPHRAGRGFANETSYEGVKAIRYNPETLVMPGFLPDRPEARRDWAEFLESCSRFDQGVGRLVEVLHERNAWENTLFIVLSDNGPPFPGAKTTLYEPGMRLPLIVHAPNLPKPGASCDALVSWVDLVPTILEFTGAAPPNYPLHGRSFLPLLANPALPGWDETFASHTFHEVTMYYPMRAVRTRNHKLILNIAHPLSFPFASDLFACPTWQESLAAGALTFGPRTIDAYIHRPRYELYNLADDPDETKNLATDPAHATLLGDLAHKLKEWQRTTKDPWIVKYDYE